MPTMRNTITTRRASTYCVQTGRMRRNRPTAQNVAGMARDYFQLLPQLDDIALVQRVHVMQINTLFSKVVCKAVTDEVAHVIIVIAHLLDSAMGLDLDDSDILNVTQIRNGPP